MLNGKNGKQGSIQYDHSVAKMCMRKNGRRFIKTLMASSLDFGTRDGIFLCVSILKNSLLWVYFSTFFHFLFFLDRLSPSSSV